MSISASTLERVYFKGRVKFKFIDKIKKVIDFGNEYYMNLFKTMHNLLLKIESQNLKVVYLDEAVFSFNTFKTKSWSASYANI